VQALTDGIVKLFEEDCSVNGIRLHVYRTGAARPSLVFAYGISDNGLCFLPIAEQLAADFEIVLYDSRGHGKSEAPETKASTIDRAHDLAGLVDALDLHKPSLLGHSMGAVTVALFAGLYPYLPRRIVLEDPPPFEMLASITEDSLSARQQWRSVSAENKEKSIQQLIEMSRRESPTWPEAERQAWAQSKQQFSLTVFDEGYVDASLGNQIVSQIICPALIVTADLDKGALYPPAAAEELAARLPTVKHAHIPGAGHNIRREQPAAFLKAVREFFGTSS
jgi:N-formylmaleamate deformylase